MDKPKSVKCAISIGELAIRLEKRWVTRNGLVQQIGRLKQSRYRQPAEGCCQKIFGSRVEIESVDVGCWLEFDGALFLWRKLCLQLVGDCFCDLVLGGKHVRGI